jgi:hypothetical protein
VGPTRNLDPHLRRKKYSFFITEGEQVQEILVGVAPHLTAFFTQRTEFKTGDTYLRPGSLLTITIDDVHYPILFLHAKSGGDPKGMGLRDDIIQRAFDFRGVLDKAPGAAGTANYIFLGDLNTMGMKYTYVSERSIKAEHEIKRIEETAKRHSMRLLTKDEPATRSNGSQSSLRPSNLDHVVAADHLEFKGFSGAEVTVLGWPKLSTAAAQTSGLRTTLITRFCTSRFRSYRRPGQRPPRPSEAFPARSVCWEEWPPGRN